MYIKIVSVFFLYSLILNSADMNILSQPLSRQLYHLYPAQDDNVDYELSRGWPSPYPRWVRDEITYMYPNEGNPKELIHAYSRRAPNLYMGVGSERIFIGAALTKALRAIFLDNDPEVTLFNRVNIALLAVCNDMDDCLELRLLSGLEIWKSRAKNYDKNNPDIGLLSRYVSYLHDSEVFAWWNDNVRSKKIINAGKPGTNELLVAMHENNKKYFEEANYLYDKNLFAHVHQLAKSGNMVALHMNLAGKKSFAMLLKQLRDLGIDVDLFDISNAWESKKNYLKEENVNQLGKLLTSSSTTILCTVFWTDLNEWYSHAMGGRRQDDLRFWHYFSLPPDRFQNQTLYQAILEEIKNSTGESYTLKD